MQERRRVEASFVAERWGGEPWIVEGATLYGELNEPFQNRIDVALDDPNAEATALLGSSCVLTLNRRSVTFQTHGIVTLVREAVDPNHATRAMLLVEPALAALRHRVDTRIFQHQSAKEILQAVLGAGLAPFSREVEVLLEGNYPSREYTVQFRESDFDFAHRLMEEEGIGYYFDHEGAHEKLVLFDRTSHHPDIEAEEGDTLPFVTRSDDELDSSEGIARFERVARVRPNRVVTRAFDWTHPSVPIETQTEVEDDAWPALETYVDDAPLTMHQFDGSYGAHTADAQLQLYTERARRDARLCDGTASSLALHAGRRFQLAGHPRPELDGQYHLVRVEHRYASHVPAGSEAGIYVSHFRCLPSTVPWRPHRTRDRPRVHGVQTATVVGPAGEEIHTDPHGRVKVQFHWDRLGVGDDRSSCWIRVMQSMGGPGWGFSFIPRIGMEVVVTFIDGLLDQPLVTGVVYNGENPSPYDLPADKTRTTIKTNSSPGGGGFNELRFEDRAGSEEIYLQGEKDWNTLIKNDLGRKVGRNEAQEVVVDRSRRVGHDEEVFVGNSRRKRVDVDESYSVGHDRSRLVENVETIQIGADRNKRVGKDENVDIGGDAKQSIGKNLIRSVAMNVTQTIGMNLLENVAMSSAKNVVLDDALRIGGKARREVGKSLTEKVGDDLTQKIKGAVDTKVGKSRSVSVGLLDQLTVGGALNVTVTALSAEQVGLAKSIVAGESISLTCGDSSLTLEKDGSIVLKGKKLLIVGDDAVDVVGGVINLN